MDNLRDFAQEWMARYLAGTTVTEWLIFVAAWALFSAGLILVRNFLLWRGRAFSRRTETHVDDIIVVLLQKTKLYFLIAFGLYLAATFLQMPERVVHFVGRVFFLVLLVQLVVWGNQVINALVEAYRTRKLEEDAAAVTSMQALALLGRLVLWSVVLLMALDNLGFDVTALITGLGIGGIAVALAVQNILGDLFASLSIVLDKPFVVGDFLIVNEYLGTVEHIGLKTTRLRSLSGEQIIFSNGDLLKSRVRNYKRMFERRVVFTIGVVYQTPHEQLAAIPGMLREIVEAAEPVRFDRAHFKEYGDFSLKYEVVYFVLSPDYNLYMDVQQQINLAIYRRFEEEGIVFAYPTQKVYVTPDEQASPAAPGAAM